MKQSTESDRPTSSPRREAGATMLEFAVVIPVLLLFVLAFIDLVRVIAIQGVLTHAAEEALQNLLVMPNTDVDVRTADPSSADYKRFFLARQRVVEAATKLPLQTSLLTDSGTPSAAQLVRFTYDDPPPPGGTPPVPYSADVAIVRPAERVRIGDPSSTTFLENPSYPYPGPGVTEPTMERLLESKPIVVEFQARVQTFTPLLGAMVVRGVAQGYRQPVIRSPLPDEDPAIMAAATPLPTPTPAETPYPFPEPSASPTPGGCDYDGEQVRNCKQFRGTLPDTSDSGSICRCS